MYISSVGHSKVNLPHGIDVIPQDMFIQIRSCNHKVSMSCQEFLMASVSVILMNDVLTQLVKT